MTRYRCGVDIGGTFTDCTLFDDADLAVSTHKQLTTQDDPSSAVLDGIAALTAASGITVAELDAVVHGTTLVTNAIIENRGTATAMLVTNGFRDVLEIREERRYDLFDLTIRFPQPVVPRRLRFEVAERLRSDGSTIEPIAFDGLEHQIAEAIERDRVEAVAVCFLHSYANPAHEDAAVAWLGERFPDLKVSASAAVFPFMREYGRWTTTCLNAYVQPVVDRYLSRLEQGLARAGFRGRFLVMSSSGGTLTSDMARRFPIRLLESGPAAGALMSATHGRGLDEPRVLSFDMGGTTAKGCIIQNGMPLKRYELEVARVHEFKKGSGLPVNVPVLDMIEIGAGGGSLAEIDERGVVRVGPRSAGAAPGPACYGRGGTRPTLTDANLVLGYLGEESFLGGSMRIDRQAAERAIIDQVAGRLGIDAARAAWGIHEVINEDVARAFRVHASERGVDYRRCSMVVFGGSGPLHGARVARKLRIPRIICPIGAGVMSAFGLLTSPLAFEIVRSRRLGLANLSTAALHSEFDALGDEAAAVLERAGIEPAQLYRRFRVDMRYEGQGHELEIAVAEGATVAQLERDFSNEYSRIFGVCFDDRPIEIVNWKAEAEGPRPQWGKGYALRHGQTSRQKQKGHRPAWAPDDEGFQSFPVYDRYALEAGDVIDGPALVEELESTCVIARGDRLTVDPHLNLVIDLTE